MHNRQQEEEREGRSCCCLCLMSVYRTLVLLSSSLDMSRLPRYVVRTTVQEMREALVGRRRAGRGRAGGGSPADYTWRA